MRKLRMIIHPQIKEHDNKEKNENRSGIDGICIYFIRRTDIHGR